MKPYSTDLRREIIEAKHKTNESIGQLAERFGVSYSFVSRLLKRYEAVARVEPNPHGGGKPPLLNSQQIEILEQLVQEDNAPTLQELSDHLAEKTDVKASLSTICRVLQRLELTRKKRLYTLMKPNLNECKT
jgi:transposase